MFHRKFASIYHLLKRNFSSELSYYHCTSNVPFKPLTLGQLAEITSFNYGNRSAIISCHQNRSINFRDVLDEADKLAAGFIKLGLQKGDKIGIWAPNLIEWFVSYIACARGGFVTVLLNPYYQSKEIEFTIKKVGMKALICADSFRKQNYYNILNEVCPELMHCKPEKICSQNLHSLKNVIFISNEKKRGTFRFTDILDIADKDSIDKVRKLQNKINFDDPCNIQLTSGTTGNPKAPVQSHFSIVNNGYFIGLRAELNNKHHKICLQNPFFHVFGTVITISGCLNFGNTIVLPSDGYDPEKNLAAISQEKCTVIFGTPTMYFDLVSLQKTRNESLHAEMALSGGALCPPKLFSDMINILKVKKVKSVYGLTETAASVFFSTETDSEYQALNTVGKVLEHIETKVIDGNGDIVPNGVPGELCVRGYNVTLGYYKDEVKTKECVDSNGWLHTGDKFILFKDGYGQIVGRLKEVIIRGGENVYAKEIEEYLITHPDILVAYIVGLPHERLGEEVCACIKTRDGIQLTVEDVYNYCKGKMSNFKIPSKVKVMDSFPTTSSGKIQKFKIVDEILKNKD